MRLTERLLRIPRQAVYLIIAAAVTFPFIYPLRFPIRVSDRTRQLYDFVEALPPGSVVCIAFDYGPSSMAELQPMAVALARHCFRRDIGVVGMALVPWGVPLCDEAFAEAAAEEGEQEHVDYVNLGYRPGFAAVIQGMGVDIHDVYKQDARKTAVGEIELMQKVRTLDDLAIVIDLASSATPQSWIAYAGARFGATVSAGVTAVMALDMYPYLQSGQLVGMLGGLKGAAEYEKLIGRADEGALGMDSQTLAHAAIIVVVVIANIGFVASRRRAGRRQAS
ncbi:MAG: hypothetical protein ACE5R4_15830 [Armatimonadota bacterium]